MKKVKHVNYNCCSNNTKLNNKSQNKVQTLNLYENLFKILLLFLLFVYFSIKQILLIYHK